jgi:hypothetical protein
MLLNGVLSTYCIIYKQCIIEKLDEMEEMDVFGSDLPKDSVPATCRLIWKDISRQTDDRGRQTDACRDREISVVTMKKSATRNEGRRDEQMKHRRRGNRARRTKIDS